MCLWRFVNKRDFCKILLFLVIFYAQNGVINNRLLCQSSFKRAKLYPMGEIKFDGRSSPSSHVAVFQFFRKLEYQLLDVPNDALALSTSKFRLMFVSLTVGCASADDD